MDYKLCLLVHRATVRQAQSYLTGMLTVVTDVHCPTMIDSSRRIIRQLHHFQDPSEIRRVAALHLSMELADNRTQADAFHASFQAFIENVLVPDCLL